MRALDIDEKTTRRFYFCLPAGGIIVHVQYLQDLICMQHIFGLCAGRDLICVLAHIHVQMQT